jgi:dynein light chain roadblock-type
VQGILIFNYEGVALKSTMPRELTVKYSGLFVQLIVKARSVVRSIDAENDLLFLRVRTKKHEVLVAPDKDYVLLVVQDPDSNTGSH